jgi:hypothetical protein
MNTQTSATTLGDLCLVRLLAAPGKRSSRFLLRRSLYPLFRDRLRPDEWKRAFDEAFARLESDGLVTQRPLGLTEAGRTAAVAFLGVDALPADLSWKEIRNRYVVPLALGVPASDRLADADGLRVQILRHKYDLPRTDDNSFAAVVNALVWRELGFESGPELTLNALRARVLGRLLDAPAAATLRELKQRLPAHAVQAKGGGVEQLREALLHGWLDGAARDLAPETKPSQPADVPPPPEPEPEKGVTITPPPRGVEPLPLAEFAERVQQVAEECESGRYGDDKVFISHVWDRFHREAEYPGLTFETFKECLCQANRQGLLSLSQAEVPESVGLGDVQASEAWYDGRTPFHFIKVQREACALA